MIEDYDPQNWVRDTSNDPTCPKLTHGENMCIPFCDLFTSEFCHKYGSHLKEES